MKNTRYCGFRFVFDMMLKVCARHQQQQQHICKGSKISSFHFKYAKMFLFAHTFHLIHAPHKKKRRKSRSEWLGEGGRKSFSFTYMRWWLRRKKQKKEEEKVVRAENGDFDYPFRMPFNKNLFKFVLDVK